MLVGQRRMHTTPLFCSHGMQLPSESLPVGPSLHHEAILSAISDVTAGFDAWILEPLEFFESGDQIVVIVRHRLRPKGTIGEFEYRNGQIWTFRDGMIQSLLQYPNPEEALEAAGLSE